MIIFWRGVWEYQELITQRPIKPVSQGSVNDKASISIVHRKLEGPGKTRGGQFGYNIRGKMGNGELL
jgi:hypothetical protein